MRMVGFGRRNLSFSLEPITTRQVSLPSLHIVIDKLKKQINHRPQSYMALIKKEMLSSLYSYLLYGLICSCCSHCQGVFLMPEILQKPCFLVHKPRETHGEHRVWWQSKTSCRLQVLFFCSPDLSLETSLATKLETWGFIFKTEFLSWSLIFLGTCLLLFLLLHVCVQYIHHCFQVHSGRLDDVVWKITV